MLDSKSDLNQLIIFVNVVDARSFTAAGRALGLPKSTVSRKIAQLEERLGVQLLRRTTRKLALTEIGAAFYERCSRIAAQVEHIEHAIAQMDQSPRGQLRVAAPHELGPLCTGIVTELLAQHPELEFELELSSRGVDLFEDGFDLALRLDADARTSSSMLSVELGTITHCLVASPAYFERCGSATSPEQLERAEFVALPSPGRGVTLQLHGPGGQHIELNPRARLVVNNNAMLLAAALEGIGVALLPVVDCRAALATGRLRPVLRDWRPPEQRLVAQYPTVMQLDAKLRMFLDELRERLEPIAAQSSVAPPSARQHSESEPSHAAM